ncbi:MAG TPA: LuxR C-terminal-related transcriptional regulator [Solirubrobacteraceae bacterium]|jgi:DNA-binding NarL/FixJ family response regulator|nr:LuxR C-terminal-related transcriptional regulator [Solirubrobacteraceae bacterium]
MNEIAIETYGLSKRFGERTALQSIDLQVPRGCAFGFLGPNGAGKTTLIRMLLGLAEPTSGRMRLLGHDLPDGREAALRKVAAIVEEPRFHGHLDIRIPGIDGIEATRRLPRQRILVLTTFGLDEYIVEALRAGASGFMTKDAPAADLVAAVRAVAAGDAVLSPAVTRQLLDRVAGRLPPVGGATSAALATLTEREREVLQLVASGMSNAEIARALVVAEPTVKTHVSNLLGKLGLRDRVQAVIYAYEHGLVERGR